MAVLLPLASGVVGALLVFFLGWLREWWHGEQKRRGLLRLLSSEIHHNAVVANTIRDSGQFLISTEATGGMSTKTWHASLEAAASLPSELQQALNEYYEA